MRRPPVDFVVIGAMKCGTTSLHHYLAAHPDVSLPARKEVDFFFGRQPGGPGNRWRGLDWYEALFDPEAPVRGDVSPGYTSPDHPEAAAGIAEVAPDARLVLLVRDPLDRAVSQYRHHRRDGTEPRSLADALLDPALHYVRRSRYAERLVPFLERFPADRIAVVDHVALAGETRATVDALCRFLEIPASVPDEDLARRHNAAGDRHRPVPADLARRFRELVADDVERFAELRGELVVTAPPASERETA
ncbi:MAG: sulfotransferase family protein [Acidimicrobiia bacterium]